eukprot:7388041-Prymnesium_polylepis.2
MPCVSTPNGTTARELPACMACASPVRSMPITIGVSSSRSMSASMAVVASSSTQYSSCRAL